MSIPTSTRRMIKRDMARGGSRASGAIVASLLLPILPIALLLLLPKPTPTVDTRDYNKQYKGYSREEIEEMDKKFFLILGISMPFILCLLPFLDLLFM